MPMMQTDYNSNQWMEKVATAQEHKRGPKTTKTLHPSAIKMKRIFNTLVSTTVFRVVVVDRFVLVTSQEPCTICKDGSDITLPKGLIPVPGIGDVSCQFINALFLPDDASSDECAMLQSINTVCGCPPPENACYMCGGTDRVPSSRYGASLDFLNSLFDDEIEVTCGLLDNYLLSSVADDTEGSNRLCDVPQTWFYDYCCTELGTGIEFVPPVSGCDVCPNASDGSGATDGNSINPDFVSSLLGDAFPITCGHVQTASWMLLDSSSYLCDELQQNLGEECGCAAMAQEETQETPATESPSMRPSSSPTSYPTMSPTTESPSSQPTESMAPSIAPTFASMAPSEDNPTSTGEGLVDEANEEFDQAAGSSSMSLSANSYPSVMSFLLISILSVFTNVF